MKNPLLPLLLSAGPLVAGNITANVRADVEGQFRTGLGNSHSEMSLAVNNGIAGFVLGANFRF